MASSWFQSNGSTVEEQIARRDSRYVETLAAIADALVIPYHRAELTGIENATPGPALFVANHNAALWTPDSWILGAALWRHGGITSVPFGLGHDVAIELPGPRAIFRRLGAVHAHPENARRLFELGHKALVYPGGDVDAMRPFRKRNVITFGGRQGYIRVALASGVPVIPVVTQGAHGALLIVDDLQWLAKALGTDRLLRMKVFPLAFSIPWGFTLGLIPPFLPFPVKIRMSVLPAIQFDRQGPEAAADSRYVTECARQVEEVMQVELTRLADRANAR